MMSDGLAGGGRKVNPSGYSRCWESMFRSSWSSGAPGDAAEVGIQVAALALRDSGDGSSAGSDETTV
jgi:hypothetical protein